MRTRESEEMYLETILLIKGKKANVRSVDIVEELGYAKSSVSRGVNLLVKKGYITLDHVTGDIEFTEKGKSKARNIYERHLILTQKGRLFFKGIDHRLYALRIHLVKKLDLLREHVELTLEVFHLIVIHVQHDAGCETLKISLVKLFHHFLLISAS